MKKILISVRPKWCEKICHVIGKEEAGKPIYEKRIEVRKSAPKKVPFKAYIYCTYGKDKENYMLGKRGKVIGEFVCDKVDEYEPQVILCAYYEVNGAYVKENLRYNSGTCLSYKDMVNYSKGKTLYGWHISDLKIYDKPKELSEFRKPLDRVWGSYCNDYCDRGCISFGSTDYSCNDYWNWEKGLTRPPQSYMFVEEVEQ